MKLWLGAEIDSEAYDQFRLVRNEIQKSINIEIENIDAEDANDWDVIAIIRNDDVYDERVRFSKKDGMDLRLKIPFTKFMQSEIDDQKKLIVEMLLRSLDIIQNKYPSIAVVENVKKLVETNA
jgi:hypothetical protein